MRRIAAVGAVLGLGFAVVGCVSAPVEPLRLKPLAPASAPPPPQLGGYRASDFAWSTQVGANAILGAVRHARSGPGWNCDGQSAALTPQTAYSSERIGLLYGSSQQALQGVAAVRARGAANPGADYSQFVRSTTCDAHNAFAFRNLPDGAYFLIVRVHSHGAAETEQTGAVIMQQIELRGGEAKQVVLPEPPRAR